MDSGYLFKHVPHGYHFAFNGNLKDDNTYGDRNKYDYGSRIYDSRLRRWVSLDPIHN